MNSRNKTRRNLMWITTAAIIAALYVALTFLAMALGLDKGAIQIRFSEALIVFAFFTPAAVPGLYVGCLLANILTGCAPLDIALGPVATLMGAMGAYFIGRIKNQKLSKILCTVPNIISNTVIVTMVIILAYTVPEAREGWMIPAYASTVFLGEVISCGILGSVLLFGGERTIKRILNQVK